MSITDYLLTADDAVKLGVKIIDEMEFMKMIG